MRDVEDNDEDVEEDLEHVNELVVVDLLVFGFQPLDFQNPEQFQEAHEAHDLQDLVVGHVRFLILGILLHPDDDVSIRECR
jgi:hypothetical protein